MAEPRRPHTPARATRPRTPAQRPAAPRPGTQRPSGQGAAKPGAAQQSATQASPATRSRPQQAAPQRAPGQRTPAQRTPAQRRPAQRGSLRQRPSTQRPSSPRTAPAPPQQEGPGWASRALARVSGGRWGGATAADAAASTAAPAQRVGGRATPWAKVAAAPSTVTTRMQERLSERRSAHRRLLTRRWGMRALIAGAGAAALWVALLSPVFAYDQERLEASGFGTVVDPTQVEDIVAANDGTSLVLLNVAHVEDQLEDLVGVHEARVERVWPSGLRVTIDSAEPVAAIPVAEGGFVLLDERGAQVAQEEAAPADLPVVNVPLDAEDTRILDGVIEVIDQMPVELRDRVQDVEAETEDSIHFVLRDGPRVEWGSAEQSALKAEVLLVLLAEAAGAEVIDVSAPTLPTVS